VLGCGWCGDVIKFVQQFDHLESRSKAIEVIAGELGERIPKHTPFNFDTAGAAASVGKALGFSRLAGISLKTAQKYN